MVPIMVTVTAHHVVLLFAPKEENISRAAHATSPQLTCRPWSGITLALTAYSLPSVSQSSEHSSRSSLPSALTSHGCCNACMHQRMFDMTKCFLDKVHAGRKDPKFEHATSAMRHACTLEPSQVSTRLLCSHACVEVTVQQLIHEVDGVLGDASPVVAIKLDVAAEDLLHHHEGRDAAAGAAPEWHQTCSVSAPVCRASENQWLWGRLVAFVTNSECKQAEAAYLTATHRSPCQATKGLPLGPSAA
jgi:hypothetical protein